MDSRRCDDAKMRRGFQKIWRAEDPKIRRCEAAGRVSENLASRRSEDPKMRSCGEGFIKSGREETNTTHYSKKYVIQKCPQNICPYSATKIRRSEDPKMQDQSNVHPALQYCSELTINTRYCGNASSFMI